MSTAFYHAALVLHIIGITLMAGASFVDYITFNMFYKAYATDKNKGLVLGDYLYKLQRFLGIGMLLILVSGILMMIKLHEVWGAQLWFRIKMGLLLIIILNGLGLRRMLGTRLRKMLGDNATVNIPATKWQDIRKRFTIVQLIQLLLFILIFTLSVFKFN
ncbi:DUF2214 family protein [Taibaiella koreensis]|uniref:DUF2214 family protein n=1 Tax=Taibaiella koreensis TaxID=1268548 RepID=UPI000E59B367|nr:DUF2214 family protein [Taibaiella koreensis]